MLIIYLFKDLRVDSDISIIDIDVIYVGTTKPGYNFTRGLFNANKRSFN